MAMANEAGTETGIASFRQGFCHHHQGEGEAGGEALTTLTRIKVDTDANGVVWLSGRAPTKDASDLAAMIAKDTEGVDSVHNDITVEP